MNITDYTHLTKAHNPHRPLVVYVDERSYAERGQVTCTRMGEYWDEDCEPHTVRIGDACPAPTQPIDCTGDPLDDAPDNCCSECGSVEPCDCDENWREEPEPPDASLVTGYDNGPTFS